MDTTPRQTLLKNDDCNYYISGLQSKALLRSKGLEIDLAKINSEHQRKPGGAFKSELEDLSLQQHGPISSNNSSHQRLLGSNTVSISFANKNKMSNYATDHTFSGHIRGTLYFIRQSRPLHQL